MLDHLWLWVQPSIEPVFPAMNDRVATDTPLAKSEEVYGPPHDEQAHQNDDCDQEGWNQSNDSLLRCCLSLTFNVRIEWQEEQLE